MANSFSWRQAFFSSTMLETVLNTLSLSTLLQGAQRYFVAVAARQGYLYLLTPQYWYGLSEAVMVFSVRYPRSWTAGLELLAAPGSSHSSTIWSNSCIKLLVLGYATAAASSSRGAFSCGSAASDAPAVLLHKSSSSSPVSVSFARFADCALVKYLKQK